MDGRSKPKIYSGFTRIALGVLAALVATAPAFPSGGDRIPGSRYVSGRGAALGDAFIGLADTVADGLFYNPAAIAKSNRFSVEPLNLQVQANSRLNSMFGPDFYKFQSLKGYQDTLRQHPGTSPGAGYAVLPNFGFPGFGFGMLYQARLMAERTGENIRYRSVYQLIPTAAVGVRLASGVLRLGYAIQWVNQASGDKTVPLDSSPMSWKEGLAEGQGFSHNFGMAVTLPYQMQPAINLVARNIGGLSLSGKPITGLASNPTGTIEKEKTSIDVSLGLLAKLSAGWQLAPQFVYRDAMSSTDGPVLSRLSLGLEFTALDRFFVRGGFGNGYPSAGLGIRTSRAEASFAWYSEDLGDGTTPYRDIRYLFHLIFRAL
jgi:hypothetical protein